MLYSGVTRSRLAEEAARTRRSNTKSRTVIDVVINARGAAVERYTPAVSRVAGFRAAKPSPPDRISVSTTSFLPRMEMLYPRVRSPPAVCVPRKKPRTHTHGARERACQREFLLFSRRPILSNRYTIFARPDVTSLSRARR